MGINMDALTALKSRVSVRQYKYQQIPLETLAEIVDCARLAPTGYNDQPWIFVVVTDRSLLRRISEVARHGRFLADAGACVAVFCHGDGRTPLEDACAATENMLIAAQALGLGSCWINSHGKDHSDEVKRLLKTPEGHELMTLVALGTPGEAKRAPKKALAEVLKWNAFT